MSVIKVKGRLDPIIISYDRAKKVKQKKFGDDTVNPPVLKASPSDLIDLGKDWAGMYGQIVSIELGDEPRASQPQIKEPEYTPEDRLFAQKEIQRIGRELGFGKNKKIKKLTLTRSSLNEYKEKHGVEYKVPDGVEIIEDVK